MTAVCYQMCVIPDGFLFLGSRLGNSMLLHYQEKSSGTVLEPDSDRRSSGPPIKRRRVEGLEQLGEALCCTDDIPCFSRLQYLFLLQNMSLLDISFL